MPGRACGVRLQSADPHQLLVTNCLQRRLRRRGWPSENYGVAAAAGPPTRPHCALLPEPRHDRATSGADASDSDAGSGNASNNTSKSNSFKRQQASGTSSRAFGLLAPRAPPGRLLRSSPAPLPPPVPRVAPPRPPLPMPPLSLPPWGRQSSAGHATKGPRRRRRRLRAAQPRGGPRRPAPRRADCRAPDDVGRRGQTCPLEEVD